MNIKSKILIDRLLGVFIAYPMNFFVRLVGFVTRFDHSLQRDKKRIVICKYKGMGSIIQSTPLIKTLKIKYPAAKITYVSSIENKAVLERIDLIDDILLIDDRKFLKLISTSFALIFKLIKKRADLYIDLEIYSNFSSIITTFSMTTDRFGFYLNTSKYRLGLYTHLMYFNTDAPITEAYLQFARLLNCTEIDNRLYYFEEDKNGVTEITDFNRKNYIVLNPNASDLRIERRWPKENFIELIKKVKQNYPELSIILIGSPNEATFVRQISQNFEQDTSVIDISGKTSFQGLIETLRNAQLVITNDTGPMHLAAAVRAKTIALFGPCAPDQYAIGETIYPIYNNLYCSPCVHEFITPPCKGNNQCMKSIQISKVFDTTQQFLAGNLDFKPWKTKIYQSENEKPLGVVTR